MRIAILQHVGFEGPGAIADWAVARGHDLAAVRLDRGDPLPLLESLDALVAMGGPMSADEEQRYPFFAEEKRLLSACVDDGRPVLGVCLGAQLLARALGAPVRAQGYREIGWFPLRWKGGARLVPGFAHVPDTSTVFHWHGDTFALPEGTVPLASSDGCENQGFASPDGRVVGLQFHLEMGDEGVRTLVANGRDEIAAGGSFVQTEEEILAGHGRHRASLCRLLDTLLDGWIATSSATKGPVHRFFARDHRRLDGLLRRAIASDGPLDLAAFGAFRAGLLRHIGMEEKVLFTAVRGARGGEPLGIAALLRVDHGAIAALLVPTPTREIVAQLRSVLEPHNRREERLDGAYDASDQALSDDAAARLIAELEAFPEPPLKPYNDAPEVFRHIEERLALSRRQWADEGKARQGPATVTMIRP
jgi:GMP synthase-like glutamine amidotransferase